MSAFCVLTTRKYRDFNYATQQAQDCQLVAIFQGDPQNIPRNHMRAWTRSIALARWLPEPDHCGIATRPTCQIRLR